MVRCEENCITCNKERMVAKRPEARGFIYATAARGSMAGYNLIFLSLATAEYAVSRAACNGTIFNGALKASSVLSLLGTGEGIVNAIVPPFAGAYIDVSPHRKPGMVLFFALLGLVTLIELIMFMNESTGILDPREDPESETDLHVSIFNTDAGLGGLLFTSLLGGLFYQLLYLVTIAYAPEVGATELERTMHIGTSYAYLYGVEVVVTVVTLMASFTFNFDAFTGGSVGAGVTLVTYLFFVYYALKLIPERKDVPEGANPKYCGSQAMVTGFYNAAKTYPQIRIYLLGHIGSAAAQQSIIVLSTQYMQFYLGISSLTISGILGIGLIASISGAVATRGLVKRFSAKKVLIGLQFFFIVTFVLAPLLLKSEPSSEALDDSQFVVPYGNCPIKNTTDPELLADALAANREITTIQLLIAACLVISWGIGIGVSQTATIAFYSELIPGGEETLYFGLRETVGKAFVWIPVLLYTFINENVDVEGQRFAILILIPLFVIAIVFWYFVDPEAAREDIKHTLHRRRGCVNEGAAENQVSPLEDEDMEK